MYDNNKTNTGSICSQIELLSTEQRHSASFAKELSSSIISGILFVAISGVIVSVKRRQVTKKSTESIYGVWRCSRAHTNQIDFLERRIGIETETMVYKQLRVELSLLSYSVSIHSSVCISPFFDELIDSIHAH